MITVEYLLPFNTEGGICRDVNSFNSLLASNADITINNNKIKFKGSNYTYVVELSVVQDQDCSVFHISLEVGRITDKFREMLKTIKRTVGAHLKDDIQIIWDGVAFEWSKELYPKIYEVENSMRKLISKFMLINLGIGWHKRSIPPEVKESLRNQSPKGHGILYESDFIQLSEFLFKPYALKDSSKLPKIITEALEGEFTDEKKEQILEFIPKNNWDRYFSEIVDAESKQLKKKWEKLYEMRCIVAHNKSMTYDQFQEGKELINFLTPIINDAINSVSSIEIPEEEKESVSLNTIATVSESTKVFINDYHTFNSALTGTIINHQEIFNGISAEMNPVTSLLNSSVSGAIQLSDPLKVSLNTIASTKELILGGESFAALNTISPEISNIFGTASNQIVTDFNIPDPSIVSKFITPEHNIHLNLGNEAEE